MNDQEYRLSENGKDVEIWEDGNCVETYVDLNANDVIYRLEQFIMYYDMWRWKKGLSANIENTYEITTSLADKVGRICRQVKHFERNDPKPDWPHGIVEDMAGIITYMVILKNRLELNDVSDGFLSEMKKAVEQHGEK